jgi:GH24 family phage-related lysozyme (muramidase)
MKITDKDIEFIVKEETGGRSYYEKTYKKTFVWPGGFSGPTAMVGIDIGYYTRAEIDDIFKPLTTPEELVKIQGGRGKTGENGKEYTKALKGITFEWDEAIEVFKKHTLPKFIALTEKTFPGVEDLCTGAQAAMLSLVFNRGTSLSGERRKEMAAIKRLIAAKDYKNIATQFRLMKRLWPKGNGLIGRREREAKLVESCLA